MKSQNRAFLYMLVASLSFAIMGGFVKALHRLPASEITFFRALVNLLTLAPWALSHRTVVATWRQEPVALLVRGVSGGLSAMLYYYAIEHMRLADAVMLNQSAPILVLVLSAVILNERLPAASIACVLVAFIGIGFIIKPDLNIQSTERLAAAAGLASTFVAAIAYVSIKVATRSISPRMIVFSFAVVATAISAPPAAAYYMAPTPIEWLWLLGTGLFATFAQETMTRGYAGLPASVASPILLTNVAFSALIGWSFWTEVPDRYSFVGMALIILGLVGANRFKRDVYSKRRPLL